MVSGEAALLFSAQPKLTADQAKAVLMQTATPLADSAARRRDAASPTSAQP